MKKSRYYLFLNEYTDSAFTRCPKCETKTKIRKIPLVVHVEPHHILLLNKNCRFCPYCELIIVKKDSLEALLYEACKDRYPEIIGNEYFVYGTIDRKYWRLGTQNKFDAKDIIEHAYPFKNHWRFEIIPGGWYLNNENKKPTKK